jgi:hypothetical protein
VPWFHGLVYKECPLCAEERDMIECERCHLRGESKAKIKYKKKQNKKNAFKKNKKEVIPKIGKTYTSK